MSAASIEAAGGRCAYHVDREAVGVCSRCGSYHCADCANELAGKRLCSGCLAIPGIDYLAEARAKAWGKRDGWVWYLGGLIGFLSLLSAVLALVNAKVAQALCAAAVAGLLISYFLMLPFSRMALFAAIPLSIVQNVLGSPAQDPNQVARAAGAATGSGLIFALFALAAYNSTRNRLAFKIEVSDRELAKYYDKYVSNPAALRALAYGILSLPLPLLVPVAVAFGVRALRRFKPDAWPPVRHRGSAIAGLVFAGLSLVLWSLVLAAGLLRKSPAP
jgi:uncharacterized MnhB-related membrane protein